MSELAFPRRRLASLQELGARLLDSRKPKTPLDPLARDLLAGFHDLCVRAGLDGILVTLEPGFEAEDSSALADLPALRSALVTQLAAVDLDGGGPRNVRPRLIADSVVAALGLTVVDEPDRTIALDDRVRTEALAAIASVVDVELAVPRIRETIIAETRARCDEHHLGSFQKITAELDERGMRMMKQPKVPLDAAHAIQRLLFVTRNAVIDRVGRAAIDRAKEVISRSSADAASRIDQPVTHRLTPRDVAILRTADARVAKTPSAVAESLLDGVADAAAIAWRSPERPVRAYKASETFAVGELIEHPKFGRGSVTSVAVQRIEVEFPDGRHTLVHVGKTRG